MGEQPRGAGRRRRRLLGALVAVLFGWAVHFTGTTAAYAADRMNEDHSAQSAYLAQQLRKSPIYISDQLPGSMPRSASAEFEKQADRTGVPTYVMVLPDTTLNVRGLADAVHQQLGRDGIYVVVQGEITESVAYGTQKPARDASRAAVLEMPSDATELDRFTRFVDVVRMTPEDAAERVADSEESSPEDLYTSRESRSEQSGIAGAALGGTPLLIVLVGCAARFQRRGRAKNTAGYWISLLSAGASAAVIYAVIAMPHDTRDTGAPEPTQHDRKLLVNRIAGGLHKDGKKHTSPVFTDDESPATLNHSELASLHHQFGKLHTPVYTVVLPADSLEDQGPGAAEDLVHRLHHRTGQQGVYVLAHGDGFDGYCFEIVNFGGKLADKELQDIPARLEDGPTGDHTDPKLFQRLTSLAQHLADTPQGPPGSPDPPDDHSKDPAASTALQPLTAPPFGKGVAVGAGAALPLAALTAWFVRYCRTGTTEGVPTNGQAGHNRQRRGARPPAAMVNESRNNRSSGALRPTGKTSTRYLRRASRAEFRWLSSEFNKVQESLNAEVGTRIWKCLDTAALLIGGKGNVSTGQWSSPGDLAAALALIRAGRAVLDLAPKHSQALTRTSQLCILNPLHGPSAGKVKYRRGSSPLVRRHVCSTCRDRLQQQPPGQTAHLAEAQLLRLRDPDSSRRYIPYTDIPGILQTLENGGTVNVQQLINKVREQQGVQT